MKKNLIPSQTIKRLPLYLRYLYELSDSGRTTVSSKEIAENLQIKCAMVRKDLSYFGDFGRKGIGYNIKLLIDELKSILHLDKVWKVTIAGVGKIGQALMLYDGLKKEGFKIVAAFDNDRSKIGRKIGDVVVNDIKDLSRIVKERKVEIGIISVPAISAQKVADLLVKSGIKALLNFAPCHFVLSKKVKISYVDITAKLARLVYYMK